MFETALVYIIRIENKPNSTDQASVTDLVSRYHYTAELSIEEAKDIDLDKAIMLIIDLPLNNFNTVTALREILNQPQNQSIPTLFILDKLNRRQTVQVQSLRGTDFLTHPINPKVFLTKLEKIANNSIENSWSDLTKIQEAALRASLKVFEDIIANISNGQPISNDDVRMCCDLTIEATRDEGLASMISAIRTHHNYTYRHSMMVSAYMAAFGLLIGINNIELQNLVSCGLLHDIGKARVPSDLLNKPAPLTKIEWLEMHRHPEYSREILETSDCHNDIKDGAIHHHEKLDGTGYPDGLMGKEVSDIARMVAIADVFSGLTEKRTYKESLSNQDAYDIMLTMKGHLDMDLLKAFKPVTII